jgi:D-3-phosphoglycerate dehydrogenase
MNVPGGNTISAAEHTVSMLLALSRNIPQANASLKRCEWKKKDFVGVEVFGKTAGIIGLGKIGAEVAKRLSAFGMKILVYDPFVSGERAGQAGVESVTLDELLAKSDYITLHTPKTDQTKNIINADSISKMKNGVRIINCARGGLIDEKALADALLSGKVKGAALDVFATEPLCESPFFEMNNVIMTPHLGASTEEAQTSVSVSIAEQLSEFFLKGTIRNAVNYPFIPLEVMGKISPYLELAEKIGMFSAQIAEGGIKSVSIGYSGDFSGCDTAPVTIAALKGLLSHIVDDQIVNYVNATVLARERGISVSVTNTGEHRDFVNLVEVKLVTDSGSTSIAGTVFGKNDIRIVKIDDFHLDVEPSDNMIVLHNADIPGVIGRVGTILGGAGINIASMEVGRSKAGGAALTVIDVDTPLSEDVIGMIGRLQEIKAIRQIKLRE